MVLNNKRIYCVKHLHNPFYFSTKFMSYQLFNSIKLVIYYKLNNTPFFRCIIGRGAGGPPPPWEMQVVQCGERMGLYHTHRRRSRRLRPSSKSLLHLLLNGQEWKNAHRCPLLYSEITIKKFLAMYFFYLAM